MRPLISIDCLTYNHALYIKDTLEGFVMQKNKFHFEEKAMDFLMTNTSF